MASTSDIRRSWPTSLLTRVKSECPSCEQARWLRFRAQAEPSARNQAGAISARDRKPRTRLDVSAWDCSRNCSDGRAVNGLYRIFCANLLAIDQNWYPQTFTPWPVSRSCRTRTSTTSLWFIPRRRSSETWLDPRDQSDPRDWPPQGGEWLSRYRIL